jgi:hypothetical protein
MPTSLWPTDQPASLPGLRWGRTRRFEHPAGTSEVDAVNYDAQTEWGCVSVSLGDRAHSNHIAMSHGAVAKHNCRG